MDELSDGERNVVYYHGSSKAQSRFNVDDAFADADDVDANFNFSPDAIRQELAKNMKHDWDADQDLGAIAASIGYSVEDASVSTFDIDASPHGDLDPPLFGQSPISRNHSQTDTFQEVQLSNEFSAISLSGLGHHSPHIAEQSLHQQHDPSEENQVSHTPPPHITREDIPTQMDAPNSTSPYQVPHRPSISGSSHSVEHSPKTGTPPLSPPPKFSPQHDGTASNASLGSKHRATKSMGPSMLDKVLSKTRPKFLPPKDKSEDKKHMADWEEMMKQSRAAEDARRKALQERRFQRERRIEQAMVVWERHIVPNWKEVLNNTQLRRLWWQGIPTKLRATLWQNAVGNPLALSKDAFKSYMARANRALASGTFPTTILGLMEEDITTALPNLHLFTPGSGPMYEDLKDLLCAWVVARSDEGLGYLVGVAKIGAMLLINMGASQSFLVLRNLLERHCMRSFYGGLSSKDDIEAYYRIFDTLLADGMPKIYFNFKQHQISPAAYLPDWLISLFLNHLPFEACARLWDVLMLEGDSFLFRAALGILSVLEPRLFFPDHTELLELLRGENKAAIEASRRSGRVLEGAAKYEIYGVDEENLWERIESMDEWWKESTWSRLIKRELPDL